MRRIQKSTGVRRETAAAYLRAAGIELRPPGGWGRSAPAKPANEVTTDIGAELAWPQPGRSPSSSACEIHRGAIEVGLARGRNAMAIWQDLVDGHGFAGSYESVMRFVRKLRGKQAPEARVVIETAPGEEAQVDYGTGPMVRDEQTGKYRRTRLFVLTLGYSRKAVRLLVFQSSSQTWAELHEQAFLPRQRPGSQGQGRESRRPREEHAAERPALRKPSRGADLPGSLGTAMGRYTHSRHDQTPGGGNVRRGAAGVVAAADRAVPLLVLYWYQSRSRIIASEHMGKIMLIRDALINRSTAAAIARITLADEPGALQSGVEFASKIIPELQFCLTGVPAHPKSRDFSRAFGNHDRE